MLAIPSMYMVDNFEFLLLETGILTVIVPSAVGSGATLILIVLIIIATACLCTRCKRGKRKNRLETCK